MHEPATTHSRAYCAAVPSSPSLQLTTAAGILCRAVKHLLPPIES